jgi:parallel beta-helix repeat protein
MKKAILIFLMILLSTNLNIVKGENVFIVKNTNPSGENSFYWAVSEASKFGGIIKFDLQKEDKNFDGKIWKILLRDNLPIIERKVVIDGLSQNEKYKDLNSNEPLIVIDGSLLTSDSFFLFKYEFEINGLKLINFKNKDYIRIETNKGTIKNISIENGDTGIHLFKSNNIKIYDSFFKNLNYGIYLYYSNNNIIDGDKFEKNEFGVRFYFSSYNEIENSNFKSCNTGIRIFYNSLKNKIHDNYFEKNFDGIYLRDSFNQKNDLYKNKFSENSNGIHLYYGTSTLIYENEFSINENGLLIEFSSSLNLIFKNSFNKNRYGIKFFNGCEKNSISENSFKECNFGIYFDDKSNKNNCFSKNIFIENGSNIFLNGGNEGVEIPNIYFAKIFGKSILISLNSIKEGKVEIFSSDIEGKNSLSFIGESKINIGENVFYVLTQDDLQGKYILLTFTDQSLNTSEFTKILINKKAPFLDLTLKGDSKGERGRKIEFLSTIKNFGDEDINDVKFRIKIPNDFKNIEILTIPSGSVSKIENNEIFIEKIKVKSNSSELIKFSFLIPDNIKINTKYKIQGEIEYLLDGKLKIIEKSDLDGIDDGYPNSFYLDEENEFEIIGKPIINIDSPNNVNINSNSIFELKISVKNSGNYPDLDSILKIFIPQSIEFLSSNSGQFKKEESLFYLKIVSLKENEVINVNLELKVKNTILDKKDKISIIYSSKSFEIKKDIEIFIKGEGEEKLSLDIEADSEVYLNTNLKLIVSILNSGTKEAKDKILKIKVPNNFKYFGDFKISNQIIEIKIDKITQNEKKEFKFEFKAISSCDSINTFEISIDNLNLKKEILIKCLKIFHNPIISGYPDGTFKPDNPIKRVEAAVIISNTFLLSRIGNENLPKDINPSYWGKDYILNVITNEIMKGFQDGSFKPENFLKRSEAAAIIFKILDLKEDYGNYFVDVKDNYWAKGIIGAVYKSGIINGYSDKTFRGEKNVTRAEFISIILKAIGRGASFGDINNFKDINKDHWAFKFIQEATIPHILINPEKLRDIKIGGKICPIFFEKENSMIMILKSQDRVKASIPFLYEDLRLVEIEISDSSFKIP